MARALVLSGGGLRGAVQLAVIQYLFDKHEYDAIYGVSVGALNGVMVAQKEIDLLFELWNSIDDLSGFLSPRWYWPFNGLYSMNPMRKKIETYVRLDNVQIPFAAGVVSLESGEYYNLHTKDMKGNKHLWDAIQSSSCIVPMMIPSKIRINGTVHTGVDGGFRNIIPTPESGIFEHLDIVVCTPLDRMRMSMEKKTLSNALNYATRGIEIMEDEVFDRDQMQLKLANIGCGVTLYSPQQDPGPSFEVTKELIEFRIKLGEEAIKHPTHIC